jgi:hypothetical protein
MKRVWYEIELSRLTAFNPFSRLWWVFESFDRHCESQLSFHLGASMSNSSNGHGRFPNAAVSRASRSRNVGVVPCNFSVGRRLPAENAR